VVVLATMIPGAAAALAAPNHQLFVYWDQNEEEDMLIDGQVKQLVQPWDPNGKVTFDHGMPSLPQPIATGLNFPTSVTICTGRDCPTPP
jgi:hypothetical protein